MKSADLKTPLLALMLMTAPVLAQPAHGAELQRNPFSRPPPVRPETQKKSKKKAASPVAGVPVLRVTATLVSPDNPMAMVNGKLIGLGERIRGARLVQVEEGAAWFEYRGRRLKYRIRTRPRSGKPPAL